jgi:predicted Zn-dependent protease
VQAVVQWIASIAHVRAAVGAPEALNAFGEALTARSNKDDAKCETALRNATKADPNFLPAQLLAMELFEARGNAADALAAAKQVLALAPERVDAARKVAHGSLAAGDVAAGLSAYRTVLKAEPKDAEALNMFGRYAFAAADAQQFAAVLGKLKLVAPAERAVHDPDLLLTSGKIETAIDQYYNIEVDVPNNPALSLKIGRIAVLRHTLDIADLEVGKLQKSDPQYGYPLLKAYVAAQHNSKAAAEEELKTALAGSRPGDDYWTSAAEVYAMLGETKTVFDALQKAADRREPTMAYILADPLFAYLSSDPKFQAVRTNLAERQQEVRAALSQLPL